MKIKTPLGQIFFPITKYSLTVRLLNRNCFSTLFVLLSVHGVLAQGQIYFANFAAGVNAPVRDATLPGSPLCAGSLYQAQLYIGPAGTLDWNLLTTNGVNRTPAVFATGNATGYFVGFGRTITSYPGGTPITAQVRAWRTDSGANWETALVRGESNLIQITPDEPPGPAANLVGLQPFDLNAVPEPSAWALLALGGAAFWCAARRRRK